MPNDDLLVRATSLIPLIRRSREIRHSAESEIPESVLPSGTPTRLNRGQWLMTGVLAVSACLTIALLVPIDNQLVIYFYFAAVGTVLAVSDFVTLKIPDWLTLTSYPAILAVLILNVLHHAYYGDVLVRAAEACGLMLLLFGVLCLVTDTGLGDLKLAGVLGLVLGTRSWMCVYQGSLYGWLLAALFVALRAAMGRGGRPVPLGAFLITGAFAALIG